MQKELPKIKDWYWKKADTEPNEINIDDKIKGLPVLFQGGSDTCLVNSVIFAGMVLYGKSIYDIFVPLISSVRFYAKGTKPSEVLKTAKNLGAIKNYYYLKHLDKRSIQKALDSSKVMIVGLWDWWLVPNQGHAMALIGYTKNGWRCVNWFNRKKVDEVILPYDEKIDFAIAFGEQKGNARLDLISAIINKIKALLTKILG